MIRTLGKPVRLRSAVGRLFDPCTSHSQQAALYIIRAKRIGSNRSQIPLHAADVLRWYTG